MKKYHAKIGFPAAIRIPKGTQPVQYTEHAIAEAKKDKYGDCSASLPQLINFNTAEVFEIECENKVLKKVACRVHYDDKLDLILAISTEDTKNMLVKTVWLNQKSDKHDTLVEGNYNQPTDF